MRKNVFTILGVAILISGLLGACTPEQIAANQAKAKEVLAAINNGARVTADAIKVGIDAACSNQQAIYNTAMVTRAVLIQQVGPKTTQNIDNLDKALAAYNNACAAASSGSTPTATILRTAISAYNSVKAAQAAAGGPS